MVTIETSVSQFSGMATFNVYDGPVLASSYVYDNNTQLTTITPIMNDLNMSLQEYIRNVSILNEWTNRLSSNFLLSFAPPASTKRNYKYDGGDRKLSADIDGNEFVVRYIANGQQIIVKARQGFIYTFAQLAYFGKCHKNFYQYNDLF